MRATCDIKNNADPIDTVAMANIARRIDKPIVLVGLMGTGKSTVGRKLANLLDLPFDDSDDAIAQAAQLSIPEIFNRFGEAYFRDGERRVIARLMRGERGIIATGGGAFVDPVTRAAILDRAIAVWIDCDIAILAERTGRRNTRPLLRGGNRFDILTRLHAERAPAYGEAPIRVSSDGGPHLATACAIVKAIDQWL
ncbi:MAG: shikimate kinase [Pontixanthobacter sp.]